MTRRILVIDDSTTIQKVIRIAFAPYDVRVEVAGSFMEALTAIHATQPEALLIDATLPGAQVPRDFQRLQGEARGVPAIILCGSFDDVDEGALRGAGFSVLVKKPFDSTDIINKVKTVIGGDLQRRQTGATVGQGRAMDGLLSGAMPTPSPRVATPEPEIPVHPELYALAREETEILEHLDPGLLNEGRRVGERAFQAAKPSTPSAPAARASTPPPSLSLEDFQEELVERAARIPGYDMPQPAKVRGVLEPLIRDELAKMVREEVEEYCSRHFQALAREVITAEIRRLSEEKSRHLVDN